MSKSQTYQTFLSNQMNEESLKSQWIKRGIARIIKKIIKKRVKKKKSLGKLSRYLYTLGGNEWG